MHGGELSSPQSGLDSGLRSCCLQINLLCLTRVGDRWQGLATQLISHLARLASRHCSEPLADFQTRAVICNRHANTWVAL